MRERLQPTWWTWLQDRRKLGEEAARAIVDPLAHHWRHGRILTDVVTLIPQEPDVAAEAGSEDSEGGEVQASSSKVAKVADRTARYVIVELHRAGGIASHQQVAPLLWNPHHLLRN